MGHALTSKNIMVGIVVIAFLVGCAVLWWIQPPGRKSTSISKRLAAMKESGVYVDESLCADCHPSQAHGFSLTGHSDTFRTTLDSDLAKQLHGKTFTDPERGYTYQYYFDQLQGLSVSIPGQVNESFPLTYALGSGHHAVTFLTLLPNRLGETVGVEHRVSIYSKEGSQELDLTPGHRAVLPQQNVDHFGRIMQGDKLNLCIGCHTTSAEIVRQELKNLRPNVGCQNCHGPGREHIIAMDSGGKGTYSGFAKQLAISEVKMCGRCHRLPNDDAEAIDPNNIRIVRFQSVGLLQSDCFRKGGESLRCTTCHDPHQPVVRDSQHYVRNCLKCHGQGPTKNCTVSPSSNCVECHMPAVDVHRGINFHDHWIRVRK